MTRMKKKLLTIVAEAGLEGRLVSLVHQSGAKGHTISTSHGEGPRGERFGDMTGGNIRLETVVSPEVMEVILDLLEKDYFPHYAVSAWVADVEVIRDERY
jgi:nitrogen regulatory protein P-II 2